jgi:chromosome segregation ATPase
VPVTRESLKADVANARHTITRMTAHTGQLERRLSELLGESAWRESGLGTPQDIDQLQRRIDELEQHVASLKDALAERESELHAARAANRELFGQINTK